MGKSCNCDNCGKYLGEMNYTYSYVNGEPPSGTYVYHKGGILGFGGRIYYFCSDRCEKEWKQNNE